MTFVFLRENEKKGGMVSLFLDQYRNRDIINDTATFWQGVIVHFSQLECPSEDAQTRVCFERMLCR